MWTLEIRLPSWLLTTVTSKKVPYCTCKPAHPRMKLIKKKLSRLINKFSRLLIEDAPRRVLGTRLCLVPSHPQHLACVATKLRVYKMADMEAKKHSSRISAQHNTLFQFSLCARRVNVRFVLVVGCRKRDFKDSVCLIAHFYS